MVEEDGSTTTKYVYGNELTSAKVYNKSLEELKNNSAKATADITYYYHYDNLKSTTLLTDATGSVVETYDYGTYGEVTEGDTTLTRFLYNGGLGVSSDSTGLYYMRARYYNPVIRRFINQDVETGSIDNSASLNRYAYVQGNPVSLTDPFGLSPDMEYGNYEANALKALYKVADKVADYLPVVGTARDIKRSYNAFKSGNIADGIKHGATAALSLAVPTAKLATKAMKTTLKLAKNALKAEKCMSKTAEIATEGIRLAGKAGKTGRIAEKAGSVSAKIAKSVKNGVSSVARTVKRNAAKVYKKERKRHGRDELVHVYRGTDRYVERSVFLQTGHLMSDATRTIYQETGSLSDAYIQSQVIHKKWLKIWGNENDYVQAHAAFGTELSDAFDLERTYMSVTTNLDVAKRFAGKDGRIYEAYIPKSQLIKQTLSGAGESEYLIKFGAEGFKEI